MQYNCGRNTLLRHSFDSFRVKMTSNGSTILIKDYKDVIDADRLFTNKQLEDVVRKTILCENFKVKDVKITVASEKKLGFLGDHFKMTVKVETKAGEKILSYFVKSVPLENEEKAKFIEDYNLGANEARVYKLLEQFESLTGENFCIAKCYLASAEIMVFEDLSLKGFESRSPREPRLKEYCFTGLASLAKLQACSFIFEEKCSRKLGKDYRLAKEYENIFDRGLFVMKDFYKTNIESTYALAEGYSKYAKNVEKVKIIREKWYSVWEHNLTLGFPALTARNVISHRDLWSGNLLFRHSQNGIPKECVLVDFQTAACLPPAADVMQLIYINSTRNVREKYDKAFLEYFYEKLTEHLHSSNYNVDEILPKDEFLQSCEKYRLWGLTYSLCLQLIWLHPDFSEDLLMNSESFNYRLNTTEGRTELILRAMKEDTQYRHIMLEYVDEFIEKYILNE